VESRGKGQGTTFTIELPLSPTKSMGASLYPETGAGKLATG